jgi:hypothetical protein
MPTVDNWPSFLGQLHDAAGADDDRKVEPLALSAASPQAIAALEQRLGRTLPPSYKSFLLTSDGFEELGVLWGPLLPVGGVNWFRNVEADWIRTWLETSTHPDLSVKEHLVYGDEQDSAVFRLAYLQTTLQIGDVSDGAVFLLNPEAQTADGEWEAWIFANWFPGARRYPTFGDLMESVLGGLKSRRHR